MRRVKASLGCLHPNGVHSEALEAGYKFWADFCDDHLKVRSCMMQQSTGIVIFVAAKIVEVLPEQHNEIVGYGVIGNTTVSGTVILGSSPGTPASITRCYGPIV